MPRRAEGRLRPWYGRAGDGPSRGAGSRATPLRTSKRPPGLPSGLPLPTPLHEPSRIQRPLAPPPPRSAARMAALGHHTATDGCTLARTDTDGRTDPDRYRPTDGPALIQTAQRRTDGPALRRGGPHGTRPISAPGGGRTGGGAREKEATAETAVRVRRAGKGGGVERRQGGEGQEQPCGKDNSLSRSRETTRGRD